MVRLIFLLASVLATASAAQERRPSHCIAVAEDLVQLAGWQDPVPEHSVRIRYVDHSTFLIQTPGGLSAATDFNGYLGTADLIPDVVTMNQAHPSHYTSVPDPAIAHVLPGWPDSRGPAEHYLDLGEMLIRNVTTNIRSRFGEGTEMNGNSIFIFEVAGLCIGHLGHLHHALTARHYAAIGRLDVVLAPVDGGMTVDQETMIAMLKRFRSRVVIPMHWFDETTLQTFLAGMEDDFDIRFQQGSELTLSLRDLPDRPTVVVMTPRPLRPTE